MNMLRRFSLVAQSALALISAGGILFLLWLVIALLRPSIRYSADVYQPINSIVCPGDTLDYTVTIFVDRTPAMPVSARSWWSVDLGRTVLPDENVTTTVWTDGTPKSITAELNIEVPDLPAGRYEMRTGLRSTGLAVYAVPFTVKGDC